MDEFDDLLEHIQRKKPENNFSENAMKIILEKKQNLIVLLFWMTFLALVLDDVSDTFALLTASQKLVLTCVYVFHTLYPTRHNYQMILAQTKKFNT